MTWKHLWILRTIGTLGDSFECTTTKHLWNIGATGTTNLRGRNKVSGAGVWGSCRDLRTPGARDLRQKLSVSGEFWRVLQDLRNHCSLAWDLLDFGALEPKNVQTF